MKNKKKSPPTKSTRKMLRKKRTNERKVCVFLVLFPPIFGGDLCALAAAGCCAPFDMESNFLFKNIQKDMVGPRGVATDRNFFVSWFLGALWHLSLC
jgi:hypothetical protein